VYNETNDNDKMVRIALRGAAAYVAGESASRHTTANAMQAAYGSSDFDGYAFRVIPAISDLLAATYIGGDVFRPPLEFAADCSGQRRRRMSAAVPRRPTYRPRCARLRRQEQSLGDGWITKLAMG
jgi:hypothetical protein